jgi:hypothetical protein
MPGVLVTFHPIMCSYMYVCTYLLMIHVVFTLCVYVCTYPYVCMRVRILPKIRRFAGMRAAFQPGTCMYICVCVSYMISVKLGRQS